MKIDKTKWEYTRREIRHLQPYFAQDFLYNGTTSPAEDTSFARKLQNQGQRDEIHILPDKNKAGLPKGTILDGCRRVRAAKANGETEIDCIIRHDLADATADEIKIEFASYNFDRRQLSPLVRARCAKFLLTVQSHLPRKFGQKGSEDLKTLIGDRLGVGLRTVNRYLAILDSPLEVQQAYDRGEISQLEAAKIGTLFSARDSNLSKRQQAELANRIGGGEPAASVVREYIKACEGPANIAKKTTVDSSLIRLKEVIRDLDKNGRAIDRKILGASAKTLKKSKDVIERLLSRL